MGFDTIEINLVVVFVTLGNKVIFYLISLNPFKSAQVELGFQIRLEFDKTLEMDEN